MIFVTVGTHEQQFNRLIEWMDKWAALHDEEVIIQTGYCTYEPKHCRHQQFFPYNEMMRLIEESRITVTHGGPSSFIAPLQIGKIPIVCPRQVEYGEHVNDHQLSFCNQIDERMKSIIVVNEEREILESINNYDSIVRMLNGDMASNKTKFCNDLEKLIVEMFKEEQ